MSAISRLLIVAIIIGTIPAFAVSTKNEAIEVAKRQCRNEMPPKRTAVDWVAVPSTKKMWSAWDGYGPGWEVHGVYQQSDPHDIGRVDMIVFVPVHGRPSGCA